MDLKLNFIPLEMFGYMILQMPDDVFNNIKKQCFDLLNSNFSEGKKFNENLYGAIEKEYILHDTTMLKKFLDKILPHYYKFHYQEPLINELCGCWINFQYKNEFNPLHNHTGDLSFVIWVNIPYSLQEEKKHKRVVNSNNFQNETTSFKFVYPTFYQKNKLDLGHHSISVEKSYEGKMIIFPSKLNHLVYPFFTNEGCRISVSGNLIEKN